MPLYKSSQIEQGALVEYRYERRSCGNCAISLSTQGMSTTFIVNSGSASKKYGLFCAGTCVLQLHYEQTFSGFEMSVQTAAGQQQSSSISSADYAEAFTQAAAEAVRYIKNHRLEDVTQVVVRVGAPGVFFQTHAEATADYLKILRIKEKSAPTHISPIIREIELSQQCFTQARIFTASDSAFHSTLPSHVRECSLPPELTKTHELYRFGCHGLSVSSAVRRIHSVIGIDPARMVVCHIGNSVSVTAVHTGKSIETSVGHAPASGFPIGSCAGDVDATTLLNLMRLKNLRPAEAELLLNTSGGLMGLAGTADLRVLLKRRAQHDAVAIHALDMLVYKIQQAIAGATAALEGLDVLVFTATAGVRSSELRALILKKLSYLNIKINEERNDMAVGKDGIISERNSPVKVVVLKTDEMGEMNAVVQQILMQSNSKLSQE